MNALYHDRQTYTSVLDLQRGEDSLALEEEERMAEDLRLLYVAITRSVFHCSVGIAPLYTRGRSKGNSDVHRSAMGYLLQKGQAGDAQALLQSLEAFAQGESIQLVDAARVDDSRWQAPELSADTLAARRFLSPVVTTGE